MCVATDQLPRDTVTVIETRKLKYYIIYKYHKYRSKLDFVRYILYFVLSCRLTGSTMSARNNNNNRLGIIQ